MGPIRRRGFPLAAIIVEMTRDAIPMVQCFVTAHSGFEASVAYDVSGSWDHKLAARHALASLPCQRRPTEESLRKCAAIHMHLPIRNPIQGHVEHGRRECTENSGGGEQDAANGFQRAGVSAFGDSSDVFQITDCLASRSGLRGPCADQPRRRAVTKPGRAVQRRAAPVTPVPARRWPPDR
jgi:hypothetical protein